MRTLSILLMLLIFLLFTNIVSALSCDPTSPKVGIVTDFNLLSEYSSRYNISLDNVQSFEETNIKRNGLYYSIDDYENIVQSYLEGKQLLELPEYISDPNSVSISSAEFEKIELRRGDIIIEGPPFSVCGYTFLGIFSPDGQLKYIIINDASDYSYHEIKIEVTQGKEIECKNYYCKVQVDYKVANEKFTLSLNQSYSPKATAFNSFTLLDSGIYKPPRVPDWTMGKYLPHLTYVIAFSESTDESKCINIKSPDEKTGCQYTPVYDDNRECIIDYEEKCEVEDSRNTFEKFIDWLKSIFV